MRHKSPFGLYQEEHQLTYRSVQNFPVLKSTFLSINNLSITGYIEFSGHPCSLWMFFLAGPPQHNSPDTELFSCPAVQLHFLALGTGLLLLFGFFLFLAPRLNDGTSFIFILIEKAILVKFPFYLRKRLTSAILCSCLKQHSLILHLILKLQSTL